MLKLIKKLKILIPLFPRKYYSIFSGANHFKEDLHDGLRYLLHPKENSETIRQYEQEFARTVGAKFAFSFGAGRMALYAGLQALGLSEDDEILIPAFTCAVVPNAMIYRGLKPVYVDINCKDFNIDASQLESRITAKTKALYAQHTFGVACNMQKLTELAKRHRLFLIEDGAHSIGLTYRGQATSQLCDFSFYSTDRSKVINTYIGGVITTNSPELAKKLADIQRASPFLTKRQSVRATLGLIFDLLFLHPGTLWFGKCIVALAEKMRLTFSFHDEQLLLRPEYYPCRLNSVFASIGFRQLQSLKSNLEHRRQIARCFGQLVPQYSQEILQSQDSVWLRYSFLVKDREAFEKILKHYVPDPGTWFTSIAQGRSSDWKEINYQIGSCPMAEEICQHVVNIPTHAKIPLSLIEKIIRIHGQEIKNLRIS